MGQVNRVLYECRKLRKLLYEPVDTTGKADHALRLVQQAEALAVQLTAQRCYITTDSEGELVFDPRYLVFEFTWNIMLFKKQVSVVVLRC